MRPKTTDKEKLLKRMRYLIGHLRGVTKMIEEEQYCIDIIKQNQAVAAAIKKINQLILQNHLNTCVTAAIESKSRSQRKRVFGEITDIFEARH